MASRLIYTLSIKKRDFVVLDFNPDRVKELSKKGVNAVYGDYGNIHLLESLNLNKAKYVISTVPNLNDNLRLIRFAKESNERIIVMVASSNVMDSLLLYREGADFVIFPEYLSGQKISDYLVHLNPVSIKKWGKVYRKQLVDEIRNNSLFM